MRPERRYREFGAVTAGLAVGGVGIVVCAAAFALSTGLVALVLGASCTAGAVAGALVGCRRRRARAADSWETFEREFWAFVGVRADVRRSRPGRP